MHLHDFDQLQSSGNLKIKSSDNLKIKSLVKENMQLTTYIPSVASNHISSAPTAEEVTSKVLDQLSPMLATIMQKLDSMNKVITNLNKSNAT